MTGKHENQPKIRSVGRKVDRQQVIDDMTQYRSKKRMKKAYYLFFAGYFFRVPQKLWLHTRRVGATRSLPAPLIFAD